MERSGLLIVGHGTREPAGLADFQRLAARTIALLPELPATACYLELAQPDIATGIRTLLDAGVRTIVVAPLLLFKAGHAKQDIPDAIAGALADADLQGVQISTTYLPPFGSNPHVLAVSQRRLAEARHVTPEGISESAVSFDACSHASPADVLLLIVGRGSRDPQATAALREFSARRATQARCGVVLSCFVVGQSPGLDAGLTLAAAAPQTTIVVQPHLLFPGLVWNAIADAVRKMAAATPEKRWYIAAPLGPDQELAEMLAERVRNELFRHKMK